MNMPLVIVIEDDEDDFWLLQLAFADLKWPCRLISFKNGDLAMNFLKATANWPVLILLDCQLPGDSGLEVLRHLRELTASQQTIVVLMSGDHLPSLTDQIQQGGGNGHFIKPATLPGWQSAMQQIIDSLSSPPNGTMVNLQ